MVSTFTFICMALALLLAFGTPVALWGFVGRRTKMFSSSVLAGLCFYLFMQLLILWPLMSAVANTPVRLPVSLFIQGMGIAFCQYLFVWLMRNSDNTSRLSLGFGIGMGLAGLFFSVGIVYFNNLFYAILLNTNQLFPRLTAAGVDADAINSMAAQLTETPGYLYLLSGFEQLVSVALQLLSMALLLALLQKGRRTAGVAASAGCHIGLAALLEWLSRTNDGMLSYIALSILTALSIICLVMLARSTTRGVPVEQAAPLPT